MSEFRIFSAGAVMTFAMSACAGLDAGVDYPALPVDARLLLSGDNKADPAVSLGRFKIAPQTCTGIDTHPVIQHQTQDDLTRFLESQGVKIAPKKARENLYWYDFPNQHGGFVRLRLAVLESPAAGAKDLHASLLEHGPGWWGVRRSNLVVLAPKASLDEAIGFALAHKLPCWGMFTMAGVDDAYVVPGPYAEL